MKRLIRKSDEKNNNNFVEDIFNKNNEYEKTNPFQILIDEYSDKILDMDKKKAYRYTIKKLYEVNEKNKNNKNYEPVTNEEFNEFKETIKNTSDALDIVFKIKDFIR